MNFITLILCNIEQYKGSGSIEYIEIWSRVRSCITLIVQVNHTKLKIPLPELYIISFDSYKLTIPLRLSNSKDLR